MLSIQKLLFLTTRAAFVCLAAMLVGCEKSEPANEAAQAPEKVEWVNPPPGEPGHVDVMGEAESSAATAAPAPVSMSAVEASTAAAEPTKSAGPITLTDEKFAEVTGKGVVLVDFWAPWCGYCRMQKPIVEKLAGAYAGRAVIAKANTDENEKSAAAQRIEALPTLVLFKDGKVQRKLVGLHNEVQLRAALDAALEN